MTKSSSREMEGIVPNTSMTSMTIFTSILDGSRNETQYTFDDFGRLVQTISPDTGTTK
jgi:YD repeat-containing protein